MAARPIPNGILEKTAFARLCLAQVVERWRDRRQDRMAPVGFRHVRGRHVSQHVHYVITLLYDCIVWNKQFITEQVPANISRRCNAMTTVTSLL